VKCYSVSETFHPVARCYYTLRHSKHSKTRQTGETFTSAHKHTQTLTRGLRSGSSAVKPARSWVLPVDREVSWKERLACVPLSPTHSHIHTHTLSQGWECRNVTFSPVCWQDTRTWQQGIVGIWVSRRIAIMDEWLILYRWMVEIFYSVVSYLLIKVFILMFFMCVEAFKILSTNNI